MKLLIVEDNQIQNNLLCDFFKSQNFDVSSALSAEEGLQKLTNSPVDVIISDYRLPKMTGGELLEKALTLNPDLIFIIITAYSTVEGAVDLIKKGAFDYIQKPVDLDNLIDKINNARNYINFKSDIDHNTNIDKLINFPGFFYGKSKKMHDILKIVNRVAQSDVPILITGESGTGKEMITDLIHKLSPRKDQNLIKINCAAIPESLLESELFGHIKGSFTGAHQDRIGKFEEADKGTILLDEIGELPLLMQVKLLRVLQSMSFEAIGSNKTKKVDVRIISATNKNLLNEIQTKNFREDLYYRLNVIPIELPPLRERREDIPDLIAFILKDLFPERKLSYTKEALSYMLNYHWEGNIRQLKNIIQRTVTLSINDEITKEDLPDEIISKPNNLNNCFQTLAEKEKDWIEEALIKCNYNQNEAAKLLGLHRNTISKKIKDYNIRVK